MNGVIICAFGELGIGCPTEGEQDANARLIAAAPEMYDLLREAVKTFDLFGWGVDELLARIDGDGGDRG